MDATEKIAAAVLYEGYVLWPYRKSATKNQKRWTLGGVYPRSFTGSAGENDPWLMQTECLVTGERPVVRATIRFLHVVNRQVMRRGADGSMEPVDELRVGAERCLTWDEAVERTIETGPLPFSAMAANPISIPTGREEEWLVNPDGTAAGVLVRSWEALEGWVEAGVERIEGSSGGLFRLTVRIANTGRYDGEPREDVLRRTFVSTHTILRVEGGQLVSMMDPPDPLKRAAETCKNLHTWPVLAGEEGVTDTVLSSPIILYDYPKIAPESPGDLFDGTEIDQLLTLNVLALADEEKEEIRASDPRAREILERAEALTSADFMRMNGAIREFRMLGEEDLFPTLAGFAGLNAPPAESAVVDGVEVRAGSRVRLRPRRGADIFDIALAGREAIVQAVEQDLDGAIQLAVVVADDPGRDLGLDRMPGHRFFFALDEVEPLDRERAA